MNVKVGDQVRIPGFPGVLKVEAISGALGIVVWRSSSGEEIRGEVFLSQLEPPGWYQGKGAFTAWIGEAVPPPFGEEGGPQPMDG
jgi:hypothetical protein